MLAASQHVCMINAIDRMFNKLPPEDEQFIYSKHVEVIIGINLKRKCIWLVLITQIKEMCRYGNESQKTRVQQRKKLNEFQQQSNSEDEKCPV